MAGAKCWESKEQMRTWAKLEAPVALPLRLANESVSTIRLKPSEGKTRKQPIGARDRTRG